MAAGWSRRWGLLAGGSPARRLLAGRSACVLLRDVPVAAERGAAFLVPRPIVVGSALQLVGRSVGGDRSGRARGQPSARPEDSCGPLGAPKPSEILALHTSRGRGAARGDIKTPCDRRSKRPAAGAAANRAGRTFHHRGLPSRTRRAAAAHNAIAKQGRSHRFITAGCLRGRFAPPAA
jgi:hypothetical protein